jgi:hypothetical protein
MGRSRTDPPAARLAPVETPEVVEFALVKHGKSL